MSPGPAGAVLGVEDLIGEGTFPAGMPSARSPRVLTPGGGQGAKSASLQVVGRGQAGLARANDQNVDLTVG